MSMSSQVARYQVDEFTVVEFEFEPTEGFRPAGVSDVAGQVREAVAPAVEAARVVLESIKGLQSERIEMKFGIKVSGGANWLVARVAAESNFEVTLSWAKKVGEAGNPPQAAI